MQLVVGLVLLAIITAIGWFLYPAGLAASFGELLPDSLRRIAWGEFLFFSIQLIQLVNRPLTIYRNVRAGRGVVQWSQPPYPEFFRRTFGVLCAVVTMVFYAFNFFGLFGAVAVRAEAQAPMWFFFALFSMAGIHFCNRAVDVMQVVDRIIREVDQQLKR